MDGVVVCWVYDLSAGCPAVQVEDLGEVILGGGGLGEHAVGFGAPAGGEVDQDGLLDAGQDVEQFADGQAQAVVVGGRGGVSGGRSVGPGCR